LGGCADVHFLEQIGSRIRIGGALSRRAGGPCPSPNDILDPKLALRLRWQSNRRASSNTYGNFPSFDGTDARGGGFSYLRYNFPNGWFVGGEGGGIGSSLNSINQDGAFGRSLYYQGVRVGYNFQNGGGLPLTFYAGFDTLKYNAGIDGSFASFNTMSGTLPGYRAHAGVEFQPTPNVSLSLGVGFTQQSGGIDSNANSPSLFGTSPFGGGR
jgi:hypothetical protein